MKDFKLKKTSIVMASRFQHRVLLYLQSQRPPRLRSTWPRAPIAPRGKLKRCGTARLRHARRLACHYVGAVRREALRGLGDLIDFDPTRDVCLVVWFALFLSPVAYGFVQFWRIALALALFLPLVLVGPSRAPKEREPRLAPLARSRAYSQMSLDVFAAVVVFGGIALSSTALPASAFLLLDMRMSIAVAWGAAWTVVAVVAVTRVYACCVLPHQAILGGVAGVAELGLAHVLRHHFFTHVVWRLDSKIGTRVHTA